ncbi:MAG: hypothetical protein NXI31_22385 [bacterium]|nr:hypothetical protein [bacterium]
MMRAPILLQSRERLWPVVRERLDAIELGLELVLDGLDCSHGQHGFVDGLARDGAGAPVLVLLAVEGDPLLLPRVMSAAEFLARNEQALVHAVPEGNYCRGAVARILVIGTEAANAELAALQRLGLRERGLPGLELCRLEPFRLAGTERFAVSWIDVAGPAVGVTGAPIQEPAAPSAKSLASPMPAAATDDPSDGRVAGDVRQAKSDGAADDGRFEELLDHGRSELWQLVEVLCDRLDPAVRIEREGLRRRITWQGRPLGQVVCRDGGLRATAASGQEHTLLSKSDVRVFGDQLVRRYAELAGLRSHCSVAAPTNGVAAARGSSAGAPPVPSSFDGNGSTPRVQVRNAAVSRSQPPARDTLRSAMVEAMLSPEEFAALAESQNAAMPEEPPG